MLVKAEKGAFRIVVGIWIGIAVAVFFVSDCGNRKVMKKMNLTGGV